MDMRKSTFLFGIAGTAALLIPRGGVIDSQYFVTRGLIFLVLIFSISCHEFAHGYAAFRAGDDTAARAGRLTLNPLAHIDPLGLIMMLVAPVGWAKPVPVNPSRFSPGHFKQKMVRVSISGILANIAIAFVAYFVSSLLFVLLPASTIVSSTVLQTLFRLLTYLYIVNLNLAVFNLLPFPPLDGYNIFGTFLPHKFQYAIQKNARFFFFALIFLVIFGGDLFGRMLATVSWPLQMLIKLPVDFFFGLFGKA